MKELWMDNPVTPEKWIDDNLKKPAMQWLKSTKILTDKIPAKVIADTNWVTPDGRPAYLAIRYNPFTHRMEARKMNHDGTHRKIGNEKWLVVKGAHYVMATPLVNKTKLQANNQ